MNFPSHAWVAFTVGVDGPEELLGCMLPDLTQLVGVHFGDEVPAAVDRGRRLHHLADAAFHDHPAFRAGVSLLRRDLRDAGLATGPRRAAAHVGYELLLDGAVPWDAAAADAFDAALEAGHRLPTPSGDPLAGERWRHLVARLRGANIPTRSSAVDELAERFEMILHRRPRLALARDDRPAVLAAMAAAEPIIRQAAPQLFDELVDHLRHTPA